MLFVDIELEDSANNWRNSNMLPPLDIPAADSWVAYGPLLAGLLADHILVACRLLGLLVALPGLNASALPLHLRCLLLIVTAAVITPNVSPQARTTFQKSEPQRQFVEASVRPVRPASHEELGPAHAISIDDAEWSASASPSFQVLASGIAFGRLAGCEACLGLLLGICANVIVQAFRMAGHLVDQQTGWGIVSATALDSEDSGTVTGELLFWMGTVMLFVMGGHLLLISTLLSTFHTFPPGHGDVTVDLIPVLSQLIQQSLSLALQLSAPVLAIQVLASLILSHAGTIAPQFQQSGTGTVVRVGLAALILLLTLSGMAERMLEAIPASIQWGLRIFA